MTRPVSQSDVLPYERCPALWHATRVRGLDAGTRFSWIGTACHVACEAVTRAVLGEDSRPLYLVARDALTAHAEAVNLPPDELHESLDIMDAATSEDSAISFFVPPGWTAAAEVELGLNEDFEVRAMASSEPFKGGVIERCLDAQAYRGRLDRIQWNEETGELEVWDWKATHDWMSGADVLLDVQARWYAMLALAWFPAAVKVKFKRVMLRLGYTATATFVRGERWHGQIMDRARRLRSAVNVKPVLPEGADAETSAREVARVWPERFGPWCRNCPVRASCKTFNAVWFSDVGRHFGDEVPREDLARRLGAAKAIVSELDERLRLDVLDHGPIPLGDGTALGFHAKRTKTLRVERTEALAELRRQGMTEDQERAWFSPSDRAMPGLVRDALEELEPNRGARADLEERLLAPATSFSFEVKEVDES